MRQRINLLAVSCFGCQLKGNSGQKYHHPHLKLSETPGSFFTQRDDLALSEVKVIANGITLLLLKEKSSWARFLQHLAKAAGGGKPSADNVGIWLS